MPQRAAVARGCGGYVCSIVLGSWWLGEMWGGWVLVSICRWSRSVWIVGDMDGGRVSDMGTRKGNSHLYSTTGKRGEFFYFFFFFFFTYHLTSGKRRPLLKNKGGKYIKEKKALVFVRSYVSSKKYEKSIFSRSRDTILLSPFLPLDLYISTNMRDYSFFPDGRWRTGTTILDVCAPYACM